MYRIGLVGDLHFANHKIFGEPTGLPGINTRLSTITEVCVWAGKQFAKEGVDEVYVLGDVTHHHGLLTPPVAREVAYGLENLVSGGQDLVVMSGNHDIDANGVSIVPYLCTPEYNSVNTFLAADSHKYWRIEGINVWVVSYGESPLDIFTGESPLDIFTKMQSNPLKTTPSLVLLHHHIEGAVHGSHEFEPPGGVKLSDIPDEVLRVYSGHYHKRQKLGEKVQYIGAPLQHDFGEVDYTPGITILTLDDGKIVEEKFIETPDWVAPRFHILAHDIEVSDIPGVKDEDYYRIDLPTNVDPTTIHPIQAAVRNVLIKPIALDSQTRSRVEEYLADLKDDEGNERPVSLADTIEVYSYMNTEDPEQAEALADQGKELLREALGAK